MFPNKPVAPIAKVLGRCYLYINIARRLQGLKEVGSPLSLQLWRIEPVIHADPYTSTMAKEEEGQKDREKGSHDYKRNEWSTRVRCCPYRHENNEGSDQKFADD